MNHKGKILQYLRTLSSTAEVVSVPIDDVMWCECGYGEVPPKRDRKKFGGVWGGKRDGHARFWFTVDVDERFAGLQPRLVARTQKGGWDAGNPQFLLYVDGKIAQGLDVNHTYCILPAGKHEIELYAYTGFSIDDKLELELKLVGVKAETEQLFFDIAVPYGMLDYLDPESKGYNDILHALSAAIDLVDMRVAGSAEFDSTVPLARAYLKANLYEKLAGAETARVACVGHTHIDVAWLWSIDQTREKARRSFATVLALMDRYPDYEFFSSQPVLYKMVKEDAPELYERVKARVAEGRWQADGAMWLEADCNLTSGESLVRQIMFGKRFFANEFGVNSRVLWLPDVFGYSAALPQILKKSGVDYFVTSKISWNDTDKMPYDIFMWRGIDGSEVPTYFITTQGYTRGESTRGTTYVAEAMPTNAAGAYKRMQQKELTDDVMMLYGFGDGGGGPTAKDVEYLRRMGGGIPGCPDSRPAQPLDFLDGLFTDEVKAKAPRWTGELYLEYHRGTYTSIAKNKRNNRKAEFLLWNVELLGVLGKRLLGIKYPHEEINAAIETALTDQFHDIIPGSSVKEVYKRTDIEYADLFAKGERFSDGVLSSLAAKIAAKEDGILAFNPHGFAASGEVEVDGKLCRVENIPPKGYKLVAPAPSSPVTANGRVLENRFYRVTFDEHYELDGIFDKRADREVLSGKGNAIVAYEDRPFDYDAWEISDYYREKPTPVTDVSHAETVKETVRTGLKITRRYLSSTLTQTVWLYGDTPRIDFETVVDWHNDHNLLRVHFPVAVDSTRATYDIQFGSVERPTTFNTSWEQAKFEVCAHKFADLSEYGYGVTLMSDCKYGYDVHDGVMSLTLLKSATYPNTEADQGRHVFTYSLMPHAGDLREAGAIEQAYLLNRPLVGVAVAAHDGTLPPEYSLLGSTDNALVVETVKEAENGRGIIARCYEAHGGRKTVRLDTGDFSKATLCDLMENDLQELEIKDGKLELYITPYEIITLRFE